MVAEQRDNNGSRTERGEIWPKIRRGMTNNVLEFLFLLTKIC